MKNQCSYISDLLRDALVIAWTVDDFKTAKVTLQLSCSDGSAATITETIDHLDDDTDNSGSSVQQSPPPRSLADRLGDIKKHTWF